MEPEPEPEPELAAAVAVLADAEGGANAVKTLSTLIKNLIANPDNPKFRRVRVSNPKIRASLLDVRTRPTYLSPTVHKLFAFFPSRTQ